MDIQRYKRGQIWWLKDEVKDYSNHTQAGTRPVIIISNDMANRFSYNLIVVPCTTAEKKDLPTHIKLEINGPSIALVENIITVSNTNLGNYIGTCDDKIMEKVDEAIKIALGLKQVSDKPDISIDIIPSTLKIKSIEKSNGNSIGEISEETKKVATKPIIKKSGRKHTFTLEDKQRILNDYKNHDVDYMLKKYGYKNKKCLQQKIYLIRNELGLGVRNK